MRRDRKLFEITTKILTISNKGRLTIDRKLQLILSEIVECMHAKSGSIMLVKGRGYLEVAASTDAELIGLKQKLGDDSTSAWVYKNRVPLYVDNIANSDVFQKRFDHYKGNSFLLTPILNNKKLIGILSITDKVGDDAFLEEEQEVFFKITGLVINALNNQRLLDSIKKKNKALRKKEIQMRGLEKLKTELFNMMVHDLKGTISEVIANLDILSYTVSDEDQECVESAMTGCDNLYSMVFNMLDVSRLEEGRLELIYEKIDPHDLLKEAMLRLYGLAKIKELTFVEKSSFSNSEANFFWADRGILLRILQNLLVNAIDYSPFGETIEVGFNYLKPKKIEFFVKDNGPGVASEYKDVIFNKYFQLENKRHGQIHATGLGLTFCKMAVEAHRGRISVQSDKAKGSCFSFILPLEKTR